MSYHPVRNTSFSNNNNNSTGYNSSSSSHPINSDEVSSSNSQQSLHSSSHITYHTIDSNIPLTDEYKDEHSYNRRNSKTLLNPSSVIIDNNSPLLDKYGQKQILGAASIIACVATLTNTILGAGMLGLPNAFAESGYILGFILLILSGCASAFGLHLLSTCSHQVGILPASFYTVIQQLIYLFIVLLELKIYPVQYND